MFAIMVGLSFLLEEVHQKIKERYVIRNSTFLERQVAIHLGLGGYTELMVVRDSVW